MYRKYGLFIDGAWRAASDGGTLTVHSPVTERPLGDVPASTHADAQEALAAAERAPLICFHAGWRHEEVHRRADLRAFTTHTIRSLLTRGFLREAKGRGPRPRKVVITAAGRKALERPANSQES